MKMSGGVLVLCGSAFPKLNTHSSNLQAAAVRGTAVAMVTGNSRKDSGTEARCFAAQERWLQSPGKVFHSHAVEDWNDSSVGISLEGLFLSSIEDEEAEDGDIEQKFGTHGDSSVVEGQRVIYLESWQMKKMVAASTLGARFVNVEALAAEVGLDSSDVLAWLEDVPCKKTIILEKSPGRSYMEDVHIVEEVEEPPTYVPPPPLPALDLSMMAKVEDLMYSCKDVFTSGALGSIIKDDKKWNTVLNWFCETVELQNPLFCLRGKDTLLEWLQLLSRSGVGVKLHDIYYENLVGDPDKRWVYVTWTATLTHDLHSSVVQLGLTDWWGRNHGSLLVNSPCQGQQLSVEKQSVTARTLQLSGDCRLEMDESGLVTNVHNRWYKLAERGGGEDFTDAKLWLSGLLRKESG